jgi:squalene cyclase
MLVAKAYEDSKDVPQLRQTLLDLQNEDGGWAFVKAGASHVHTTGECMYALSEIGEQRTHPALEKARKYLLATQTENGSWIASSRRNPAKTYDISNFWATSWAAIGLLRTFP